MLYPYKILNLLLFIFKQVEYISFPFYPHHCCILSYIHPGFLEEQIGDAVDRKRLDPFPVFNVKCRRPFIKNIYISPVYNKGVSPFIYYFICSFSVAESEAVDKLLVHNNYRI